jgi:hypothetical protein
MPKNQIRQGLGEMIHRLIEVSPNKEGGKKGREGVDGLVEKAPEPKVNEGRREVIHRFVELPKFVGRKGSVRLSE